MREVVVLLVTFPPHTRGSTGSRACTTSLAPVSPAYAGIDLSAPHWAFGARSFPRIRGDRPHLRSRRERASLFPPHTRGSTGRIDSFYLLIEVSPAYAGIDLRRALQKKPRKRFPRIRGDRPRQAPPSHLDWAFPPHTRGSTVAVQSPETRTAVSPAYAGIDPIFIACILLYPSFPRIRGDRPRIVPEELAWNEVSPAYAGIDLTMRFGLLLSTSFPRIRGDRPARDIACTASPRFPPHTRGSTGERRTADYPPRVSPAYAGIDRLSGRRDQLRGSFPRIRGDRPC